jgi:hypothetical protein
MADWLIASTADPRAAPLGSNIHTYLTALQEKLFKGRMLVQGKPYT